MNSYRVGIIEDALAWSRDKVRQVRQVVQEQLSGLKHFYREILVAGRAISREGWFPDIVLL